MNMIKDIIKIHGGYSAQVKLKEEFEDRSQNVERMSHYKPIKAHRKAFETIAEGIYRKDSKRCFILSGSYGTGKSHLCLMTANYLESPSDMPEMEQFFQNYAQAEEEEQIKKADQLKNIRKTGRYLVCICDYGLETSFETIVLRAIKEALEREEINPDELDSHYLQALKKLELWESKHTYFYNMFQEKLESTYPNWTMAKFKKALKEYSKEAVDIFCRFHKDITTSEFEYEKDNLVEIIKQMANSRVIRDKFVGIAILFDEFDNQIKNKRFDVTVFQKFGEMCENSFAGGFVTMFIATIHRSFLSYRSIYNDADFQVASDRVKEIPLETQGIEDIISAIVIPQKDSDGWKNEVEARVDVFNSLASRCESLGIFSWLSAPKRRKKIIENIYPMHPMATFALLKLASDVGSNNRSVFTFFADEKNDPGSYDWFVRSHSITGQNGELQLYTVDLLFDYFGGKISTDNTELRPNIKEYVRDFETSLRELHKHRHNRRDLDIESKVYDKILRTMVIYNIIGVPVNMDNLKFGLNANTQAEEKQLEYYLKNACRLKIIYLNETNSCYEFRKSDAHDIGGLIREYKQDPANMPADAIKELREELIKHPDVKGIQKFFKNEEFLEPKDYNSLYNEDKRLKRFFVTVKEAETDGYFANLYKQLTEAKKDIKNGFEGAAVYIICETPDEVRRASSVAARNSFDAIMVGVPTEEIPVYDLIFSLKACINISLENFSAQDMGVLKDYIKAYDTQLEEAFNKYISSKNLIYYGKNGIELTRNNSDNNKAASKILEGIYEHRRNKLKHEDLNVCHEFKEKKNTALKEAVESLLDFSSDLGYKSNLPADRGDKRYIEKALLQSGVIIRVAYAGDRAICQMEAQYDKYRSLLPALSDIIGTVKDSTGEINIVSLVERMTSQYGIGYNACILFFAVMLRYFKESILIKQDINEIGSIRPFSYDEILDLVYYKKYKNAVIIYKKISDRDEAFIKKITPIFVDSSKSIKNEVSLSSLFEAMKAWYKGLHPVCKIEEIYNNHTLDAFIRVFDKIDRSNPVEFILEEIKTIYGYEKDELLLEEKAESIAVKLKSDKETIEEGYEIVRNDIINKVKEIFGISDSTYEAILQKLNQWYEGLSDIQRETGKYYELHSENSLPIIENLGKGYSLEELLMVRLPGDKGYKLSAVKEWTLDKREIYIEKIRLGKKHIEENMFLVGAPDFKCFGHDIQQDEIDSSTWRIYYRSNIKVTIKPLAVHSTVYITSNGDDPTKFESQREAKHEEYTFETKENKTLKFAAADREGRYSKIITLYLENEDKKYEVQYKKPEYKQSSIWGQDKKGTREYDEPKIEVTLPKDKNSMKKCLMSLLSKSMERYKIDKEQLLQCLDEVRKEL